MSFLFQLCPAKFTQFVHLKLHRRLHTNERPYECPKCNRKYISASGLKTHWKTSSCLPADTHIEVLDSSIEPDSNDDNDDDEIIDIGEPAFYPSVREPANRLIDSSSSWQLESEHSAHTTVTSTPVAHASSHCTTSA